MTKTYLILLLIICTIFSGCNKNKAFFDLKQQQGTLSIINKENSIYEFGDCYLHTNDKNDNFVVIVTSANDDAYVSLFPTRIKGLRDIENKAIGEILVSYYSRKPGFMDYIFGGEIPYGSFDLSFERNDQEALNYLKRELRYVGTLNLDKQKIKNYGGTSLISDTSLNGNFERCLNFGTFNDYGEKLAIQIPH